MQEKIQKVIDWIRVNYDDLPESTIDGKKLVIFATGDFGGEYGYGSSDLEGWGVDEDGNLFWAYASGCSCGCSAGTEEKTVKLLEVEKLHTDPTDILKALELFETDKAKFKGSIASHDYSSG